MKKALFLAVILAIVFGAYLNAYAQEPAAPMPPAAMPEAQEAYGEVVSVDAAAGSITITEYDYEKDEDINRTYTVDKAAAYENVKSLAEVKAGDWVALTVKPQKDGVSIATSVYIERYDIGEEPVPVAMPEPAVVPAPAAAQEAPAVEPAPETPAPASEHPSAMPMPETSDSQQ